MQPKLAHHNAVILKGRKDGINILLDPHMSFAELTKHFERRVIDAKQFFEGAKSNIAFKGRKLSEEEERALMEIIIEETTLDIPFVMQEGFTPPTGKPEELISASPVHLPKDTHVTAFHRTGLRSGQSIHYDGSLVIMGDVNPGSEIVAAGNIIIMGALKGMVHAGAGNPGDISSFVSALSFAPTQIRIAHIITYIPEEKQNKQAAWAYIKDDRVCIEALG